MSSLIAKMADLTPSYKALRMPVQQRRPLFVPMESIIGSAVDCRLMQVKLKMSRVPATRIGRMLHYGGTIAQIELRLI